MEVLTEILAQNLENRELDYSKPVMTCSNCGEPIQKDVVLFGKIRRVPITCRCRKEKLEQKAKEEEYQEKQIRLNQIFKNSLMDEKFFKATFESWDHGCGSEKIYNICFKYAENFAEVKKENLGLLIYGEPGNGKTHAVSCIANYLLPRGIPTICVSINKVLERIKETYNSYGREGEETVLRSLSNADLLILDDLGTEQNNDWSITRIYNIIDSRYRNSLPTVITTNMNLKDLEEKYQKRTYNRLLEMCTPVFNDGKSIRTEKAKDKTKVLRQILA